MRRWRIVLAGAAVVVPMFLAVGPASADPGNANFGAMNDNARCRVVTNLVRQAAHEASDENFNQEINQVRNEFCGSLNG